MANTTVEILPPVERGERGRWLPGRSPNPLGPNANEEKREMHELARTHSLEAVEQIVSIMRHGMSERNRLTAAEMLLDRAWGKPKQTVDVEQQGRTLEDILRAIAASREAERAANP